MAAPCAKAGLHVHMSNRIFICKFEQLLLRRNSSVTSALGQNATVPKAGSVEEIVIPKKKTWDKLAVLKSLASTVNRDPTASRYMFQDDPYLTPRTTIEFKLYSLSLESGRNAAKYIINTYPKFFLKDFAEPHIPCLMPETLEPQIEEVSEAALVERIKLRKVGMAVDLFDQLLQNGTVVSTNTTNDLLDLICFYGDLDPMQGEASKEVAEDQETPRRRGADHRVGNLLGRVWRENNNAERIYNLMPERNERAYCALIRGMVKYGADTKAFSTYMDMLNNRLTADVHTFNALISAAPNVREDYHEKWNLIMELLKHMEEQKVRPNLLTFNAVLKSLRRCGSLARTQALLTLAEMKALGIEPSLATYCHVMGIFYKAAASARNPTKIIYEVMDEVSGKSFSAQDPDDVQFFPSTMRICLDLKDIELAYRLHRFLGEGNNWQLLGDSHQQSMYYGRFFNLLCMMEHVDVVLKWYREITPSLYFPTSHAFRDLLQALDTDNRLDLIPEIWKDIKQLGHAHRAELVEEVLTMMARDKHSSEVQESFANCALDMKKVFEQRDHSAKTALTWTASALGNIISVLLAAARTREAWDMLELFKRNNRVPTAELLEEFVCCAQSTNNPQLAVELVQLSHSFSLPTTTRLAHRVAQEFQLSDEQKKALSELEASDSESDSSKDE
ncbi:pentatricopeptide repeat domain-containing protein 3, mitochondrial isoform X1 [Anguilla anguilla]|uniref:pentatricopeptide repeat domain-containing protein 3, mitochondrial isoform X1 n=1 Tax=Anguilla anguilla TaxID=7936 RepID=UPI0015A7ACAD|nr:pentatricopeptide repeat domain-containing protein 3, mitochondrial isoform X1 [Anguilla anguilla]